MPDYKRQAKDYLTIIIVLAVTVGLLLIGIIIACFVRIRRRIKKLVAEDLQPQGRS